MVPEAKAWHRVPRASLVRRAHHQRRSHCRGSSPQLRDPEARDAGVETAGAEEEGRVVAERELGSSGGRADDDGARGTEDGYGHASGR